MRFIFYILTGVIESQRYHVSDRIPLCECGEEDPEWGSWQGCEKKCSDTSIQRIRERTCEKMVQFLFWRGCPDILTKQYHIQQQFENCDWIPKCGEF